MQASSGAPIAYPEHEKLKALDGENQIIGDFLEWLGYDQDIVLCQYSENITESRDCTDCLRCTPGADPVGHCWSCDNTGKRTYVERSAGFYPAGHSSRISSLLADYFEIDEKGLEREKQAMLGSLREQNLIVREREKR